MRATWLDLYQLTSLVPHADTGRLGHRVVLTFFSRRLPQGTDGAPLRPYLVWAALSRCLDWLEEARFTDPDLQALSEHPTLGPALRARPSLASALRAWRFQGRVEAAPGGTLLSAGPAVDLRGERVDLQGVRPAAYVPYLQVETDLLSAKLIETPLLSTINHLVMVASKADRVVQAVRRAAPGATLLEFGSRRTHPVAAVDAALAAWIAGCDATSNVEAHLRFGVPCSGTMDHFAVQAWERPDRPVHETEVECFQAFHEAYPGRDILLVDTYDTFGARTGLRAAVQATGKGPYGVRIDSGLSVDTVRRARELLDALGANATRIFVSGGIDEAQVAELARAPVDGFGVGERIVTSPDAPVGVGAVAKIAEIDGQLSMKLSRGSGKASLPGRLQAWRVPTGWLVGCASEEGPGEPVLTPVWEGDRRLDRSPLVESRARVEQERALRGGDAPLTVALSDALVARVRQQVARAADLALREEV
jgi:nicotinate phosphoribosyltransferase